MTPLTQADLPLHAVVYTPAGPVRPAERRPFPALVYLLRETWDSRDMITRLVRRDVQSRYRQFYLGGVWLVLNPAITMSVFFVLNRTGVLNVGAIPVPYPLYVLVGITIWQLFASGVGQGTSSLVGAGSLLSKVNVSKAALVVAAIGTSLVDFAIRAGFVVVVYLMFRVAPSPEGLLAIPALVPLLLLTLALSFIQSILGVVVRDIATLFPALLGLLVFLMPIYYEKPSSEAFTRINNWNPLYHLVCGPRDLLLRGHIQNPEGFWWSTAGVVVLLVLAARFFATAQYKLAERA